MNASKRRLGLTAVAAVGTAAALTVAVPQAAQATGGPPLRTYSVTVVNTTAGQPLSPLVASTHRASADLFSVGSPASEEIAAIAQGGDESGAAALLASLPANRVTDIVRPGAPIVPSGVTGTPFGSEQTFAIDARPGDRLSLASMLICTNDGFTGLDALRLPAFGQVMVPLHAYDAGVEQNTEASGDIVDPCSALGPVTLAGDPNGNVDGPPAAEPMPGVIAMHPGVTGAADLLIAHDWGQEPVGYVVIERV